MSASIASEMEKDEKANREGASIEESADKKMKLPDTSVDTSGPPDYETAIKIVDASIATISKYKVFEYIYIYIPSFTHILEIVLLFYVCRIYNNISVLLSGWR